MSTRRPRLSIVVIGLALVAASCSSSSTSSSNGHVLLVGTFHGHAGQYKTIQSAVDAAKSGDWVLVAPGDYHEQYDHSVPAGEHQLGAVYVTTPNLHLRGMDRNTVVVDGTKPGAPQCSTAETDQDWGQTDASGKLVGRNGIEVWKAIGTSIDNLTACNFMRDASQPGTGEGGNQIWWNGGDGSGVVGMGSYNGSYITGWSSFASAHGDGGYGIFVSNSNGPGVIVHSYASNMSDAGYYVGACNDCNATIDDAHAQYNALGYSGTNAGGHLIAKNSEWDHNKTGFSTNSQNNDDAPSPQDGTCPNNGSGPTGTHSCWIFENNYVHDNNNPNVPAQGSAELGPPGNGLVIGGGRNDTVSHNRFESNGSWAVLTVPFPDTASPPPVAHCVGGDPNGIPSVGLKGCYYGDWGNEVVGNSFKNNGGFGNPTNGDIGTIADEHDPGNCFHDNTNPGGVTTSPANLQVTNGTCGVANAGASVTSELTTQVVCAAEAFGPCPATPGQAYPRQTKLNLPGLSTQPTMPNPCAGVPNNPWCTKSGPISAGLWWPGLLAVPAFAPRRARRRRALRLA
jgi:hypothetical protein